VYVKIYVGLIDINIIPIAGPELQPARARIVSLS
jgi:hypothetical protein